jgi:translation initiation factor 2 alpha subunit (eIF-2alpha)
MTTEFDQETVIAQVTERLREKFGEADPAHIEAVVREEVANLAERPVHDYVAVLGERAAKKRLKGEAEG